MATFWYNGFLQVWNGGMKSAMLKARQAFPSYELWITGESMGGSLSANAAPYISLMGYYQPKDIKMISFGQTRIGDATFAQRYPTLVPYAYRIVHRYDVAPHIIPHHYGYRHHGSEVGNGGRLIPAGGVG